MTGPAITLLRQLLAGRTTVQEERTIVQVLTVATTAELNEVLADPELTDRLLRRRLRVELIDLLTVQRRAELGVPARAALIHALQTGHTGRRAELIIRDLFCEVRGADLTTLKNLLDATPNHHDLEQLVFGDIRDPTIRGQLLSHISAQAAGVRGREAKVLSDIDDTTICSLHDRRFPRNVVYPGVLALWAALDQGPHGAPRSLGDLTFVTARPSELSGWVENQTRNRLRNIGVGTSSMLSGSLRHLFSHAGMAGKKIENITHFHQLFPEYRLVFIGDSGQGDVLVGQRLIDHFGGAVDAVLIHDVVATDPVQRQRYAEHGVQFFDTYVGAAVVVFRLGLISREGLTSVFAATRSGFDQVPWRHAGQETAARELLRRDLVSAAAVTTEH